MCNINNNVSIKASFWNYSSQLHNEGDERYKYVEDIKRFPL